MSATNTVRAEYHRRAMEARARLEGGPLQREVRSLRRQLENAEATIRRLERERDDALADCEKAKTDLRVVRAQLDASVTPEDAPPPINLGRVTRAVVLRAVADVTGYTTADIVGPNRLSELAIARQVAAYLMREMTPSSMPEIGQTLGGRDHTTILHACRITQQRLRDDVTLAPRWVAAAQARIEEMMAGSEAARERRRADA